MSNDKYSHRTPAAPKRFVNLHGHSTFSIGDAIGLPQDHIDFAIGNGLDALAITDHGNMNGFSHQYLHSKKLASKGVNFKPIYGCEFYFIPSLDEWRRLKSQQDAEKAQERALKAAKKNAKESGKTEEEEFEALGVEPQEGSPVQDDEDLAGTVVENEEESKASNKWQDPIKRRNHLVVLAKNAEGLRTLYRLVSNSYADGFYMYPRIDLEMLRREAKGNLIASSACLSGDAVLETNEGLKTLKEVVAAQEKREIFVLGFSEKESRPKFGKVVWGALTRKKAKTLVITLANGKSVRCTPDHKFLTNHGWLRADEIALHPNTSILTY